MLRLPVDERGSTPPLRSDKSVKMLRDEPRQRASTTRVICRPWWHVRRGCSFCAGTLLIVCVLILCSTPSRVFESILVQRYHLSSFQLPGLATTEAPMAPFSPSATRISRLYIQGTSLRGRDVRRFWSHQECFSETGQWVLDETPRATCCKVKVYHTANFTRCDYALQYCNATGTVVYGSPLPASLAAQARPWTSRKELKWFWQTSPSCPMVAFDRAEFCKRIGRGRHLLISGDSISYQLFITFLNFLRSELSETQYPFHGVGFEPVCADLLGGEGFNLAWVCSPLLNTSEVTRYIEEWKIEILIMNRGAWFRSDESFVTELQEIVHVLQARYPHLLVVYRNTSPGHKGCADLHGPLEVPQERGDLPYHWGEFGRQNEMAQTIIHRAHFIFLDVDTMLRLRPDGHMGPSRDCLHYSIPGPLDVIFYLFYNTLLLL